MGDAKTELGEKIQRLKKAQGLSWKDIAQAIGHAPVWSCAACLGQMSMSAAAARKTADLLGLFFHSKELAGEVFPCRTVRNGTA